jgi:Flp pilus assembly protein TadG
MERTSVNDIVRLADEIRALTLQRNAIGQLGAQSARLVWACQNIIKEYEGHTTIDTNYLNQVAAMKVTAEKKVAQCDKWLAVWGPKLSAMVEQFNNQERD